MSLSDPLGDMLTRIRNAYGRKKTSVSTPASKLRARVLEVLKSEGYIRDFSQTDFDNGKSEIEIELKYAEGQPVIREITIRNAHGSTRRPVVRLKFLLRGQVRSTEVSLYPRDGLDHPLLLGRQSLKGFLVDPAAAGE